MRQGQGIIAGCIGRQHRPCPSLRSRRSLLVARTGDLFYGLINTPNKFLRIWLRREIRNLDLIFWITKGDIFALHLRGHIDFA